MNEATAVFQDNQTATDAKEEPEQRPVENVDGYLVDEDGEIVGHAQHADEWHIATQDDAEWAMSLMLDEEATIAGLERKYAAILQHAKDQQAQHERRRRWLELRFGQELQAFARANLPRKGKTWTCPYGTVAFRTVAEKIDVKDEAAAIAWVKSVGLASAVKTIERLVISACKDLMLGTWDTIQPDPKAFERVRAHESVTIKTGV